jgi:hypothetical protein
MSTAHLDTIGMIHDFNFMGEAQKQKAVWRAVIGFWGGQQKRESVVCS